MGIIFDIKSLALHNGPGIRTVVRLKGCGLRCEWCIYPESHTKTVTFSYNQDKCTQCLECTNYCPTGTLTNVDGQLEVNHNECIACGRCLSVCKTDSLNVIGEEIGVDKVIAQILKDKPYFDKSNGGVTRRNYLK